MISLKFNAPLSNLRLHDDEIHVWKASLDQPENIIQALTETLSIDEKKRAEGFYFEKDRKRFIARRGILRTILGRYLSVVPSRLPFGYGEHGKPELSEKCEKERVHFNLSHSEGLAIFAFTRRHEVGIDIEKFCDIPEMNQIVGGFFSKKENAVFQRLPEKEKKEAFFILWTRKEAVIKAVGDGLFLPLSIFTVLFDSFQTNGSIKIKIDSHRESIWSILDLEIATGFKSALAVKQHRWTLQGWQWLP